MDKNTLLFMEGRTKALGDNIALGMKSFLGWKELTFKGLSILAQRLGNYLIQLNINKGDVITIALPNIPLNIYAFYALNEIGVIQNIIHPLTKIDQIIESLLSSIIFGIPLVPPECK